MLAAAGFGVLLPDWVRRSRLGLKLTTKSRTATGPGSVTAPKFGLADLVDFRYELAVGDQTLDPDELAELARLKVPLVRLRGQWVELDERHLKAALQFLERGGAGVMSAGDALLAGLGEGGGELPLTEVDADGWLGDLLSGHADSRLEPMGTPASFRGELRPYQERGLAWLSFLGQLGLGAVLADDMGLGKSPQTLALLQAERDSGTPSGPTLLDLPDVAGRELAARGGAVHARARRARAPRRRPARRARAGRGRRGRRPGHHDLRRRYQGPGGAGAGPVVAAWSATRRRTSRTRPPGRPRPCGRSRPARASRSPARRSRTG